MSEKQPNNLPWHVRHSGLAKTLAIAGGLFIGATLVEFGLAQLSPHRNKVAIELTFTDATAQARHIRLFLYPPNYRQAFRPSGEYLTSRTDTLAPGEYVAETDEFGFYKPGLIHPNADLTIAFLGGSTTENFFMASEERFPAATARAIELRTGLRVNSMNVAKSGSTSFHSINNFLNLVLSLRPNVAVFDAQHNDFAVLHHEGTYWNDHPDRSLIIESRPKTQAAETNSWNSILTHICRALGIAFEKLLPNISYHVRVTSERFSKSSADTHGTLAERWATTKPIETEKIIVEFKKSLRTFVAIARIWNVRPVLLIQSNRWPERLDDKTPASVRDFMRRKGMAQDEYQEFRRGYIQMNDAIRQVSVELDVPLIDLTLAVPSSSEYLFDAIHMTGKGSVLASKYIADRLITILQLPTKTIP